MKDYDRLEELPFETYEGAHSRIRVNVLNELSKERQRLALRRLRVIVESEPLDGYDCTDVGAKNNECTWGMCQQNKKLWPDSQDYIWPHDKDKVSPLCGVACPLDTNPDTPMKNNGCFFRCRFFKSHKFGIPSREEILSRIDESINKIQ